MRYKTLILIDLNINDQAGKLQNPARKPHTEHSPDRWATDRH